MNMLTLQHGLPYVVVAVGLLIVMVGISIKRTHLVAASLTLLTLIAGIVAHVPTLNVLESGGLDVDGLVRLDGIGVFFNLLFLATSSLTVLLGYRYLETNLRYREEFYLLLLTLTFGAMCLPIATHYVSLLLGLEIVSISLYAMIAYPDKVRPPLEAALKYLILSGIGSTTILFGMALNYAAVGSMAFGTGELTFEVAANDAYFIIGQVFIWSGIAFKLSLVPFHIWTPDVYEGAPALVTGLLATISKGAVFAVVMRYAVESDLLTEPSVFLVVSLIAVLSMIVGNLLALLQKNLKRLLAYSSIAHMGYLLITLLMINSAQPAVAFETLMLYVAGYFLMTIAAFGLITVTSYSADRELNRVTDLEGLFWTRPALAATMTATVLSLAGIPLTIGFIAKFYLFTAGIEGELWLLVWSLIIGSAIGIYYYLRLVFAMTKAPENDESISWTGMITGVGTLSAIGLAIVVLGIYPAPLIDFIQGMIAVSGI